MITSFKYITLIICVCFASWSCKKKLRGSVTITGKAMHYYTREPIVAKITLKANDNRNSGNLTWLTDAICFTNGEFKIRSKPARSEQYHLFVDGQFWNQYLQQSVIDLQEGQVKELGDVLMGEHTFHCKISLKSVSSKNITFLATTKGAFIINAGKDTTIIETRKFNYQDYEMGGHTFSVMYRLQGQWPETLVKVPFLDSDTARLHIDY